MLYRFTCSTNTIRGLRTNTKQGSFLNRIGSAMLMSPAGMPRRAIKKQDLIHAQSEIAAAHSFEAIIWCCMLPFGIA